MTAYGAGLRVSETVALKVSDIDSKRMLLHIEMGKGQKDRYAMLSPRLLEVLRTWYRAAHPDPKGWLYPAWRTGRHINANTLQMACREAAQRAGLSKRVTVHTLRHISLRTCWTMAPTRASFKRSWVTARSPLPCAIRAFRRNSSAALPAPWINSHQAAGNGALIDRARPKAHRL